MRLSALLILSAVAAVLSGCSRVKVTTQINADGSATRTVAFTGQDQKEGAMQMGGKLEDAFVLPSGKDWKTTETKKDGNRTLSYERKLVLARPLQGDVSLKDGSEGGKVELTNSVTVTRTGKRFEYSEKLQWKGDPPSSMHLTPENMNEIKALLPKPLATDDNARAVADKMMSLVFPMLFGPGDPLLAVGLIHPDLAERRVTQRIGGALLQALEQQFGDKLTLAQRREIALKLVKTSISASRPTPPDPSAGPAAANKDNGGLTPLMFVLRFPGHVISTNGEVDELTGEIYWALFSEAAALKDLVLSAVVELDPSK